MHIADTTQGIAPFERRTLLSWIAALGVGAALLAWIALANGFPMIFSDSGSYLAVATELTYLSDRPMSYGLLIAPFVHLLGLWGIVILQAIAASWLIGEVLVSITMRRSPAMLVATLAALAAISSLPWFVGQIMPDLATSLMALTLYLVVFVPRTGWQAWFMAIVLLGEITLHLSHVPIAAALIGVAGLLLLWRDGWRAAVIRTAPAIAALVVAILGLCTVNLLAWDSFRPSAESDKFLAAKTFDSGLGQPVLRRICASEPWQLCKARAFLDDPRRTLAGQDYLWATDSPRVALDHADPDGFRAEEGAFARRVFREDPTGTLRVAVVGWRDQMVQARAADGMIAYAPTMGVVRLIHQYFPRGSSAFDTSRQQRGVVQRLAIVPDRAIALLVALTSPLILWGAIRRGDQRMVALATVLLGAVVINGAVCGMLSGPDDRYQSRILWLIPLLGLIALAKRYTLGTRPTFDMPDFEAATAPALVAAVPAKPVL